MWDKDNSTSLRFVGIVAESFKRSSANPEPRGRWNKGINHRAKQGRLLRFINGNDLSICWSQFTRVSWAGNTMGRPTYELPAPLRRVHKTTGIAAGEHPKTPPTCTDHQMTQMGQKQTKTRLLLYNEAPFSKAIHATNWGNLAWQHSAFALLFAWVLRHGKWNQIYGSRLQNVVKIKHTLKTFSEPMLTNNSLATMLNRNSRGIRATARSLLQHTSWTAEKGCFLFFLNYKI